jgi:hypothetical protein
MERATFAWTADLASVFQQAGVEESGGLPRSEKKFGADNDTGTIEEVIKGVAGRRRRERRGRDCHICEKGWRRRGLSKGILVQFEDIWIVDLIRSPGVGIHDFPN